MPLGKIHITYFDGYGRADPVRIMLAFAKHEYTEDRIT